MKQRLIVILISSFALSLAAQPRLRQPEMYIGAQGGVIASMTNFSPVVPGTDNVIDAANLGADGGLLFRYYGHKYCGLQVELNYMHRGWRENIDSLNVHYSRHLHYIELPFLFHLYLGNNRHRGFLNLGPQIGYCIADKQKGTTHPASKYQYNAIDNRFDYGITAGLGYCARTDHSGSFQLEVRFSYSFSDLFSNRKSDYFAQSHPMNLSLNLGYLWEFKQRNKKT
ncbi:MAG: PorT family protein [Paludibacteraceae bacterium]|nr:PorT family protein [Paludibacteraceae bacterium]